VKGGILFDGWWNNAARQYEPMSVSWWNNAARQYEPMSVEEVEEMEKQIRKQQEQDYKKAKGK
jgi:hypothetical protein